MDSNGLATPRLPLDGAQPGRAEPSTPALNLRQKLAQVRREVGYIQKRGKNELHDYSYAMAADIAGAIGDRLAALNVVLGRRNLSVKRERKARTDKGPKRWSRSRSIISSSTAIATKF
jgi:hypothetical protein